MDDTRSEKPVVIGISGLLGAGKTTAAQYLAVHHGFNYIRYSQVLAEWFNESSRDKSELQVIGWEVMSGGQQDELNRRLIAKMSVGKNWCVDGLRHPIDYQSLKNNFPSSFRLVYIECPQQERWLRLQERSRFNTFEEFLAADAHPVEQQIMALKQFADLGIPNAGRIEELHAKLNEFMPALRREAL